jgi:hypothetical protein
MKKSLQTLWSNQQGQDIAEDAGRHSGACCGNDSIGGQQRQQRVLFSGELGSLAGCGKMESST